MFNESRPHLSDQLEPHGVGWSIGGCLRKHIVEASAEARAVLFSRFLCLTRGKYEDGSTPAVLADGVDEEFERLVIETRVLQISANTA